jgi:hypothetical protein
MDMILQSSTDFSPKNTEVSLISTWKVLKLYAIALG